MWNTWAIDGDVSTDVKHPASVARLQTFAAFAGREGVISPLDMRVQALDVPGTAVRVMPGAGSILNRATGSDGQAYAVQNYGAADEKQIAATDSGGGRSDLVVARVENPFIAGENFPLPADPENGPYTYVRVVQGVPAGTTSYHALEPGTYGDVTVAATDSVITLARIDIPVSTATILDDYITDLRTLASPLSSNVQKFVTHSASVESLVNTSPLTNFPANANMTVSVPPWATSMDVDVTCRAMRMTDSTGGPDNQMFGRVAVALNGTPGPQAWYNETWSSPSTELWTGAASTFSVDDIQGQDATLQVMHSVAGGNAGSSMELEAYEYTTVVFRVTFNQEPI